MVSIIRCLLLYNQYLISQINELLLFISRSIPYRQWKQQDSHSPKYQKFKVDKLPSIIKFELQDHKFLIEYYLWKYKKQLKSVNKGGSYTIVEDIFCPKCSGLHNYLSQLLDWAFAFKFKKNNAHIMGLCLTYHVNIRLSTRKTMHALKEIHNVEI